MALGEINPRCQFHQPNQFAKRHKQVLFSSVSPTVVALAACLRLKLVCSSQAQYIHMLMLLKVSKITCTKTDALVPITLVKLTAQYSMTNEGICLSYNALSISEVLTKSKYQEIVSSVFEDETERYPLLVFTSRRFEITSGSMKKSMP